MKKILLFLTPICIAVVVFFLISYFFLKKEEKGTLQVTSQPQSTIYLNGKIIGQTPFPKTQLPPLFDPGEYTIRLVPIDPGLAPFQEHITITPSVLTVIDRSFSNTGQGEGSIIGLTPIQTPEAEILVLSFPDKAQVYLDSQLVGDTPLNLKNVPESDHELRITRDGYKEKAVPIRTKTGYRLSSEIFLSILADLPSSQPASSSATTPSPTSTVSRVTIIQTPTGFLRVRDNPSLSGNEIGRVTPGESYPLLDQKEGWDEIKLTNGDSGWISSSYVQSQ